MVVCQSLEFGVCHSMGVGLACRNHWPIWWAMGIARAGAPQPGGGGGQKGTPQIW